MIGAVYKLDSIGNETVLYSFTAGADGGYPFAGLTRDSAGNLYGTTQFGCTGSGGVVFEIAPPGISESEQAAVSWKKRRR